MTDQNEELLTFRITAAVTEAVDQAIRRRYIFANIAGAAAIVLVGWLGGTSLIASQVKERVDTAVQIYDQTFRAHKERLAEVNGGFNAQIKQIDENEQKLQEELGRIRSQTDQIKLTVDDRAFIYNTLSAHLESIKELKDQTKALVALASTVDQMRATLTKVAQETKTDTAALNTPPSLQVTESLKESNEQLTKTTVYLQFSGAAMRSDAQLVSAALKQRGFRVRGEERVASKVKEVRFYYRDDEQIAQKLAQDTNELLREKAFGDFPISARNFENYSGTKPPRHTLELWLGELPHVGP
jgi:hypothetical protein